MTATSSSSASASPADVVARLRSAGLTIAAAESLTGGLVCAALTEVPGASAVVRGAVVSYATDLKASVLGVDPEVLAAGGAVQAQVAREMALGAARVCGADVGIGTTGVAGPDAQDGIPVGTVFVAVARAGQPVDEVPVRELGLGGDRSQIRGATVIAVLGLVTEVVSQAGASGWTGGVDEAEDSGRARG